MQLGDDAAQAHVSPCPVCGRPGPTRARFCGDCGAPRAPGAEGRLDAELEIAPEVADPLLGRVIADRYRIHSLLGRGGMGVVYKVEHVHIGKLMAMKLLHGELARDTITLKRFRREAEAASRLSHPSTVQVFDFGRSEGLVYLVMELVEGEDWGALLRRQGPMDFPRVARLVAQICGSVHAAHAAGVVHRDLKPENVMITQTAEGERAKVLDFGLAKLRDVNIGQSVTRQGAIVGTPYYMSPEQIRGEEVDARGDVYALGAIIYRAIVGTPPFTGDSPITVLTRHLTDELVPPTKRSPRPLPEIADVICGTALAKDRDDRYPTAAALRAALADYLASQGETIDPSYRSAAAIPQPVVSRAATREDVDSYEHKLRRRSRALTSVVLFVLASIALASFHAYRTLRAAPGAQTVEKEPNDELASANALTPGVWSRGAIGRRRNRLEGDVDVYVLTRPSVAEHVAIDLVALPNVDMMVEVFRIGDPHAVLTLDAEGVGGDEALRAFPLGPDAYAIQVREHWRAGVMPTENISDRYRIRFRPVTLSATEEVEVNDGVERATPLRVGTPREGVVGWVGDRDTYCLDGPIPEGPLTVALSPVPTMDLALRVLDRVDDVTRDVDDRPLGQGETARISSPRTPPTCVEVMRSPRETGARAAPGARYRLLVFSESSP